MSHGTRRRLWQQLLRRIGASGTAALALLPASAAIAWWLPQLDHDADALRAQVTARAAARPTRPAPRPVTDGDKVRQFVSEFPALSRSAADVTRLFALAHARHISLSKGEYQLRPEPNAALVSYTATFQVRNEYAALKAFAADVLEAMPHVSMDEMRMSRTDAASGAIDSRVRFTFVYRNP